MGVVGVAVEARGGGAVWPCGVEVGNWLVVARLMIINDRRRDNTGDR